MRLRTFAPVLLVAAAAGCSSVLDVTPTGTIPADQAIVDVPSATAALGGAYNALQDDSYYGVDYTVMLDLSSDNTYHSGTFASYADADANFLRSDNGTIDGMWDAIYQAIDRDNQIISKVPSLTDGDAAERDEIVGEAYFLRALNYHNLVKVWGGVPLALEPTTDLANAGQLPRASEAEVYTQILSDLDQAASLITATDQTRRASVGAVKAIEARVRLYMGDWAGALAAAQAVDSLGLYSLAPDYADLFTATGSDTQEDIFRITFTPQQFNNVGYYYLSKSVGGRREVAPDAGLLDAYLPNDQRMAWSISVDSRDRIYGSKFRTPVGDEDLHVIRYAEVILTEAEAYARLNQLPQAVAELNLVRSRAGVAPYVLATQTQQEVIDAILQERQVELAFEGDRWPDLVRTGRAVSVLGLADRAYQVLYPIPQAELDVAPGLTQNPGY